MHVCRHVCRSCISMYEAYRYMSPDYACVKRKGMLVCVGSQWASTRRDPGEQRGPSVLWIAVAFSFPIPNSLCDDETPPPISSSALQPPSIDNNIPSASLYTHAACSLKCCIKLRASAPCSPPKGLRKSCEGKCKTRQKQPKKLYIYNINVYCDPQNDI